MVLESIVQVLKELLAKALPPCCAASLVTIVKKKGRRNKDGDVGDSQLLQGTCR